MIVLGAVLVAVDGASCIRFRMGFSMLEDHMVGAGERGGFLAPGTAP